MRVQRLSYDPLERRDGFTKRALVIPLRHFLYGCVVEEYLQWPREYSANSCSDNSRFMLNTIDRYVYADGLHVDARVG